MMKKQAGNLRKCCAGICMALCFLFVFTGTGCDLNFSGSEDSVETEEEVVHEKAAIIESDTVTGKSPVIAVGETTITYDEYKAYYYFMSSQYETLLTDDVWRYKTENDKTIGQEAIEETLRLIIQVKVICKEAKRAGVELEADEKEDADYAATQYLKDVSSSDKKNNGLSEDIITGIFEENKLAQKMYNVVAGEVETSDVSGAIAYKTQLIFKKKGDDAEKVRQKMEELKKEIASSEKSFYTYAISESEADDIETIVGSLDERKNLYNTVTVTKNNVVSQVVEEDDGYYLALILEKPNDELNTEYINDVISTRQTKAFQTSYDGWSENYDVEVSDLLLSSQ